MDERVNSEEVVFTSYKFGELWSTNSGVYGDGLATIYAPNARNRRNAFDKFDSWDSYLTTDDRNH